MKPLSHTSVRRLTVLREHLRALPPPVRKNHFDMDNWVQHHFSPYLTSSSHHSFKNGQVLKQKDLIGCGMAACAWGHAATIPSFRRAGVSLTIDREGVAAPRFKRYKGFAAASRFFQISKNEAAFLFSQSETNDTPGHVVASITMLLNNRDKFNERVEIYNFRWFS